MSELEKIQYELVAAPYLIKYDYQLEYPWLSLFWFAPLRKLLYFLARSLNDLRYWWRDRKTVPSTEGSTIGTTSREERLGGR